jgi:3-isopropylmalate/(R)-2-methylmalate dehydratase small subunit
MSGSTRTVLSGPALVLDGDDIDTDRIMPARFLRAITFEGIEAHVFEDDRRALASRGETHPFDDPARRHARIMIVGSNFGCGSSREHAPQGLARFGIKAMIGESFSEIFLGNCSVLGVPCFTANHETIDKLQALIEQSPETTLDANVETGVVTAGPLKFQASMPAAVRDAFVQGKWDPTMMLLDKFDDVRGVAKHLPYVSGF